MNMIIFNHRKAVQALNYFALKNGGEINVKKAIKLIWLSDRLHIRTYCRPIFNDTYYAMQLGPVPSAIKDIAMASESFLSPEENNYRRLYIEYVPRYKCRSIKNPDLLVFSDSEVEVFEKVIADFGDLDQFQLSKLSHNYPEWYKHKEVLDNEASRVPMSYQHFFEDSLEQADIFNDDHEVLNICKDIYCELS